MVASRSDCEDEHQEFIVDSGASLHMMSKNELTACETNTIRRSKEPTVITWKPTLNLFFCYVLANFLWVQNYFVATFRFLGGFVFREVVRMLFFFLVLFFRWGCPNVFFFVLFFQGGGPKVAVGVFFLPRSGRW